MAQIICQNLKLGYDAGIILSDIQFSANQGDYLCIVGENGSGKTTLMKALLGLHVPISGNILFGDGLKSGEIGYMPQQTIVQKDFPASVREIVLSGCMDRERFNPFYNKEQKKRAAEYMKKLGIENLSSRCYRELSGGQQQRVLLARALCAAKRALILDEPVAGLDLKSAGNLYDVIKSLNQNDGITVIMVTHDPAALSDASHILHIGKTVFFGTRQEYLEFCEVQSHDTEGGTAQ